MISDQDKLDCVKHELEIRRFSCRQWLKNTGMKWVNGEREVVVLEAIAEDYRIRLRLAAQNAEYAKRGGGGP